MGNRGLKAGSFTLFVCVQQLFCFPANTRKMGQGRGLAKAYEGISVLGIRIFIRQFN